jgi:F-type H+-transporting ATPase subunit delta
MSIETIARRYGSALADVVLKNNEAEAVAAELKAWEELFSANPEISLAFGNPAIGHMAKERVLEELIKKAKPLRTTANFLRVLLKNSRLIHLSAINEKFAAILEERYGIVPARIIAARELTEAQRNGLRDALEQLTGKKVKLDFQVEQEIIGGVIARLGSTVFDGSVKTRLEELRTQLLGAR